MTEPTPTPRPRRRVRHPGGGRQLVKQADAPLADINEIMKKWHQQGVVPQLRGGGRFGDFSNGMDYQTTLDQVIEVREFFERQTAAVRNACANDPAIFLDKIGTGEGIEELAGLGLEVVDQVEPESSGGPARAEAGDQGSPAEAGEASGAPEEPPSP